jgi:hypothetical protein
LVTAGCAPHDATHGWQIDSSSVVRAAEAQIRSRLTERTPLDLLCYTSLEGGALMSFARAPYVMAADGPEVPMAYATADGAIKILPFAVTKPDAAPPPDTSSVRPNQERAIDRAKEFFVAARGDARGAKVHCMEAVPAGYLITLFVVRSDQDAGKPIDAMLIGISTEGLAVKLGEF